MNQLQGTALIAANFAIPSFKAQDNRDAWQIIRGFVYQADLSIVRWLDLHESEELQLECGEDIDTVTRYLDTGNEERLLEQVKHIETNVTLRNAGALSALANAVRHVQENPSLPLRFRFSTNAAAGCERPSPFADRQKGIEVWQRLHALLATDGTIGSGQHTDAIQNLRLIISSATCPDKLPQPVWQEMQAVVSANDQSFIDLIVAFEWSTNAPSSEQIVEDILERLQEMGYADNAEAAYSCYQRLFLYVLKTMTRRAQKRLTRAMLTPVCGTPLEADAQQWFDSFLTSLQLLDKRLLIVQSQLARQGQVLTGLADCVRQIFQMQQLATLNLSAPIPIWDVPPIADPICLRTQTVDKLHQHLSAATWLALHGTAGTGKSCLALLVANRFRVCPLWLRLRDMSSQNAAATLDAVFLHQSSGERQLSHRARYETVCAVFGPDAVIVLDDLPMLVGGDALCQRIELLVQACADTGVRMVSTSAFSLPASLTRTARHLLQAIEAAPLTNIEAMQMLKAAGAPESVLADERKVRFLNNLASQHPTLLAAIAAYLRECDWQWTDQAWDGLLLGHYGDDLGDETLRRFLATVTGEQDRNLLYRLNLVQGVFNEETARLLASVEPAISSPREKLTALTGLWVQRDSKRLFRVSPLLRPLGGDDLEKAVRQSCCLALAQHIFHKDGISLPQVDAAVNYLISANEPEQAVITLVWGLNQMIQALHTGEIGLDQVWQCGLLPILWNLPIPEQVSLNMQIALRSYQIDLGTRTGRNTEFAIEDLSRLVDRAGAQEGIGLVTAALYAVPRIANTDFALTCRCLLKAVRAAPQARYPNGEMVRLPATNDPTSFLWLNLAGATGKAEIILWCETLGQLPQGTRQQVLEDPEYSSSGTTLLMDRFWLAEAGKPQAMQNWEQLLADMNEIEAAARSIGAEFLQAAAERAKILICCERLGQVDRAVRIAEEAIATLSDHPRNIFMICDSIGRKLSYRMGREQEAERWLSRAELAGKTLTGFEWECAMTLLSLSRLADQAGNSLAALRFAEEGVELVRDKPHFPDIEWVKMLGDLAIAQWKHGALQAAFDSLDEAALTLLRLREDTVEWKALLYVLGHATAHLLSLCEQRGLPGSEDDEFTPPSAFFHDHRADAVVREVPTSHPSLVASTLWMCAEAVGRDERLAYWAEQTLEITLNDPEAALLRAITQQHLLPLLASQGRYADLFDAAREVAFALAAGIRLRQNGNHALMLNLDMTNLLGPRGSDYWNLAEQQVLDFILVPLAFHLGALAVRAWDDAAIASELARAVAEVVNLCHTTSTISSYPELWREAADVITYSFDGKPVLSATVQRAKSYVETEKALRVVCYIGSTLHPAVNLKDACRAQMSVLPWCLKCLGTSGSAYRLLVLPYLELFWKRAFTNRRFCFTPPDLIAQQHCELASVPVERRAKRLMELISSGLGVRANPVVATGFRDWDRLCQVGGGAEPSR